MSEILFSLPCAVVALDAQGQIEFVNAEAERLTGWSLADLREDPDKLAALCLGDALVLLESGNAVSWRQGASGPWPTWYLGSDQTEMVRNAERLRLLSSACTDGVFLHEAGVIRYVNPPLAELFACAGEELVGRSVVQLVGEPDREKLIEHMALGSGAPCVVECLRPSADPFAAELRVVDQGAGGLLAVSVRGLDDTSLEQERRALETQTQHAQKLESLGLLAGGIAHDFNNLLVGIIGNAGLVRRRVYEPDTVELIVEIERAATRAAELTQQLLAYSGKGRFLVGPVAVNELIHDMTHLLGSAIHDDVVLRLELADGLPRVEGDLTQLRQVVMNLVVNASDAIGQGGGTVTIRSDAIDVGDDFDNDLLLEEELEPGVYVSIEVSDTGVGMSDETLTRIFDPFFTTKGGGWDDQVEEGRGLGLPAVLGIVRSHQGAIEVLTQPGEGSTFTVLLPASFEEVPETEQWVAPISPERFEISGMALVVDDEETVRQVARLALEDLGLEVLQADDGLEAIELYDQHRGAIQLILLDLTMPRLDGAATFKRLTEAGLDAPVLFSSGYDRQDALKDWEGPAPAGFLQKPYRIRELQDLVRRMLG